MDILKSLFMGGNFRPISNAVGKYQNYKQREAQFKQEYDLKLQEHALRQKELEDYKIPSVDVKRSLAEVAGQNANTNAQNAGTRERELGLNQEKFNYKQTADQQKPIAKNLDSQAWAEYMASHDLLGPPDPQLIPRLQADSARRAAQRAGSISDAQNASALGLHKSKHEYDKKNPPLTGRAANDPLIQAQHLRDTFASLMSKYNAARASDTQNPEPYAEQLRQLSTYMQSVGVKPYYDVNQLPQQSVAPPSLAKQYVAPVQQQPQAQTSSVTATDAHVERFQELVNAGMPEDQAIEQVAREMQQGK